MHYLFNPGRFLRIARWLLPIFAVLMVFGLGVGVYIGLFDSPADYQQGETVRIMYVHVPSAWMSLFIYSVMAGFSVGYLVWRNPLSSLLVVAAAPIGMVFAFLCLVTGSLWGKPMWGAWWVWDARLTSMLILFLFYVGLVVLASAFQHVERAAKSVVLLTLFGFINVPVVKFSVDYWNTLHQPASILRSGGVAIDSTMLLPLGLMFLGFVGYFGVVLVLRTQQLILARKVVQLHKKSFT